MNVYINKIVNKAKYMYWFNNKIVIVHEEIQRNVNFNNLDQLNSWCTSKAKSKRDYTWKQ